MRRNWDSGRSTIASIPSPFSTTAGIFSFLFFCYVNDATTFLVSIDCCAGVSRQRDEVSWTRWLAGWLAVDLADLIGRIINDDRDSIGGFAVLLQALGNLYIYDCYAMFVIYLNVV